MHRRECAVRGMVFNGAEWTTRESAPSPGVATTPGAWLALISEGLLPLTQSRLQGKLKPSCGRLGITIKRERRR